MGTKGLVGAALAAWVVAGCGVSETQGTDSSSLKTVKANVVHENGVVLNGINPNGTLLNKVLVSVQYDSARIPGTGRPLEQVWLMGSEFHGLRNQQELSGQDFRQARFFGDLDDGSRVALRIDSVTQGTGTDSDVWSYRVSYQEPQDGQWYPLCKTLDGTVSDAIALEGQWNYGQGVTGGGSKVYSSTSFTFACDGYALAKCVRFGYKPWDSVNGVSLADYHQSCTRLLRADFCGDGTPHTVNGNLVNIYDSASVQTDAENWGAEAEWNANGASCFTSHNRSTTPIQCADGRLVNSCGQGFSSNTLLISETP
ncbi:ADYC domain-containing protein [Hyalangium versicolor]|uniref:ADYC domain-containing protein n=1 Tax=Hyalangium versicolor TaxID=2861190 RepID=UPI001CC9EC71|nr:ADYC domain-containing protein [Hyalangium versicolor]